MKQVFTTLLLCALICVFTNAQTTIPGGSEISGVWTKSGSPYLIEGEITLSSYDTLIIEKGVRVEMMGWYKFNIEGHFEALGAEGDTIVFTTQHPDSTWHGLRFDHPRDTVRLKYVKIENGHAELVGAGWDYNNDGGGIYGSWGRYIIEHSVIQNNHAESSGGGCHFQYAYVKFSNSRIFNNSSEYGGGISMHGDDSRLILINSVVKENECTQNGGGINCNYTPARIYNSEISGNAGRFGGGFYCGYVRSDLLIVSHTMFSSNTAERGSGFYGISNQSKGFFSQCLFRKNTATSTGAFGATITNYSSQQDLYFSNCIIYDNQDYISLSSSYEKMIFENSILWQNGDILDMNQLLNFEFNYSDLDADISGTGNINSDPHFLDPANTDFRLSGGSPCLNTGNPFPLNNDIDGTSNDMGIHGGSGLIVLPMTDTLDYGPAAAGDIYHMKIINTRNEAVTLQSISFTDTENFSSPRTFPVEIMALDSVWIPVEYHARSIGEFEEELTLTSSDLYGTTELTYKIIGYSGTFGELTGRLTLAGSPYLVTGDITIPANDSLIIDPGVEMQFAGRFQINVFGHLKAIGNESDSIYFGTVNQDSLWGGIIILNTQVESQFEYIKLSRASSARPSSNYFDGYGAITCRNADIRIKHSRFTGNYNQNCAGVAGINSKLIINNTYFDNNNADYDGMIFIRDGFALLNKISCRSNKGGALSAQSSEFVLVNSIIADQMETIWAHLDINGSEGLISNCVLYDNIKYRPLIRLYEAKLEVLNSIFWELGTNPFDIGLNGQLAVHYSNIEGGYDGIGNIDSDPIFEDAASGDFHLGTGSPCIDAGFVSHLYDDPDGSRNDMGAYGGNGLNASPPILDFDNTGKGQEKTIPLRIYNLRVSPVNITSITLTDEDNFSLQGDGTGIINSMAKYSVLVTVKPVETGWKTEHVVLGSTDLITGDTIMIPLLVNAGYWEGEVSGVWKKVNSPYIFGGSITVPEGKSLLIEPGVQVQIDTILAGTVAEFRILGSLHAQGMDSDSIVFTTLQEGIGIWKGIVIEDTAKLAYCLVENATNGIEVRTSDISILNCLVRNNERNGIFWNGDELRTAGRMAHSVIIGNQEYGIYCEASCYDLSGSATPVFEQNTIKGNQLGGVYLEASGYVPGGWTAASRSANCSPDLLGNFIHDNLGPGITVHAFGSFAQGTPVDLTRYGNAYPRLFNNVISSNQIAIKAFEGTTRANVEIEAVNNTIWDNGDLAIDIDRGSMGISNSIIWGSLDERIQSANEAEVSVSYSNLKTTVSGENIISEDPLFAMPDSNNFRIGCLSPCVNTGDPSTDTTGFSLDFDQNPRLYAGRIDMGAFENIELPQITGHPSDLTGCTGAIGELSIQAEGAQLNYTWYQTNAPTSIGNDNILVFDILDQSHSGSYFCTVNNYCDVPVVSDTAELTVLSIPPPMASFEYSITGRELSVSNTSEDATTYLWEFGDGDTSSAENPKHNYDEDNEYTVVLTASNICGEDADSSIVYIITDINDWRLTEGFLIFPNPASEVVNLTFKDVGTEIETIQLLDFKGNQVKIIKPGITGDIHTINLENLAPGIYFIRISLKNKTLQGRFILE